VSDAALGGSGTLASTAHSVLYVGPVAGCFGLEALQQDGRVRVRGPVAPALVCEMELCAFEAVVIDADVGDEAFDVLLQLSEAVEPCRAVVIGSTIGQAMVREIFLAGGVACLRKPTSGSALFRAVLQACDATLMMRECMSSAGVESMPVARRAIDTSSLTPREHEILQLLMDGRTTPGMAEALDVRPRTVKFHVSNLLRKLGAGSRLSLLAKLRRADAW